MPRYMKPFFGLVFVLVTLFLYQNCGSKFQTESGIISDGSFSNVTATDTVGSTSVKDLAVLSAVNFNKKSYIGDGISSKIRVVNTKTKKILDINSDGSIPGENVRIEFVWFKDGQKIVNHNSVSNNFRLKNLTNDSKGNYSVGVFLLPPSPTVQNNLNSKNGLIVLASSNTGEQIGSKLEFMKLDVYTAPSQKIAPIILDSSKSQILKFGHSVILSVKGDGFPLPTYQWKKDGKILGGQDMDELVLYNLGQSDQGIYTCVLKNELGEVETADILISLEGQNVAAKVSTEFRSNYEVTLNASWTSPVVNATGNPFPTVKWYKDNVEVSVSGSVLNIPTASFADTAVYKVEAKNSGSSDKKEFTLTVVCPSGQGRSGNSCIVNEMACDITNGQGKKVLTEGAYGPCQVSSCLPGFHSETNLCLPNSKPCTLAGAAGGKGKMFWNFETLQYSSCSLDTCASATQHIENGLCVEDIQNCQISNGQGYKTWNGATYSSCKAKTCNDTYHAENDSCVSNQKVCAIENANSATQTWNGATYGPCTLVSCVGTHHKEGNACLSNVKSCDSGGGLGFATWDSISNQFSACLITSCKKVAAHIENNKCIDDPSCSGSSHLNDSRTACETNFVRCTLPDGTTGAMIWDNLLRRYNDCAFNPRKVLVFTPISGVLPLALNIGQYEGSIFSDESGKLVNHILFNSNQSECPYTVYENSVLIQEKTQETNISNIYDIECGNDILDTTSINKLIEAKCVEVVPAGQLGITITQLLDGRTQAGIKGDVNEPTYKKHRVECQ